MSVITEEVAARLRRRGYDATHGSWDALEAVTQATDFVVVNAITVIGWRYPTGDWLWDDRPAYLVDKGPDPLRRLTQPPYFDSSHRWEWLPSSPHAREQRPRDNATAAQLAWWIAKRLPAPSRPITVLYRHPREGGRDTAGTRPWTSDWEKAWADEDEQASS
jgi:hypothetical protein